MTPTALTRRPWWRRIDYFMVAIVSAAVLATFLPARGAGVEVVDWASKITIAILFFLYGVRLQPAETLAGLKHWRLHTVILAFTFVAFPIVGLALRVAVPGLINEDVYRGLLYICLLPSTVQSSINFTSIARGNVAAAIISASMSNLLGVFITPLLAISLMSTTGMHLDPSSILDIAAQILLPFVLGQLSRRWTADFVMAHPKLKLFDQASIVLVVYRAFGQGVREGLWQRTGLSDIAMICVAIAVILPLMLWLTWMVAGWLGFNRRDQIAIQFCGTKKSLATGVPMASVMFPAAQVGMIVLPLMIFHQAQLMVCSSLASRYARKPEEWLDETNR
ncbi:MAG: bile acid:sodium symporter [Propionibacteriaceae bacterium]|jgi:sodium/bile acid cotransporter 7|uniref:Bile acid:sodium symporter n=1 Tax=Brooklawnia propionicigenes TaxID=3041175 RepID=A0AAN0K5Z5_9ACTN|nr:bile acid:sodium symporter family protein [Brooklawnia sp. SH051]MCB0884578.1 bile acid:sodium symporter [Propionibacteriaceae bacterium]MEA5120103.1 bile acid:sodium symporter family protein [Propionibacterium sp.]NLI83935.1 bile acid:sodium symporter [Propionibacterium sp.]BEH01171.1 bile acid:sodium symporter [Brooklawnia sp. SH051]